MRIPPPHVHLTRSDEVALLTLAQYGALTRGQIEAHLYGGSPARMARRMRVMKADDLVVRDVDETGQLMRLGKAGRAWVKRDVGFVSRERTTGARLPRLVANDWCLRRPHGFVEVDGQWRFEGEEVISPRDVSALAAVDDPYDYLPYWCPDLHYKGIEPYVGMDEREHWVTTVLRDGRAHRPSAAVVTSAGGYAAVEVRLRSMNVADINELVEAYEHRSPYSEVRFVIGPPALAERFRDTIDAMRLGRVSMTVELAEGITCEWIRQRLWESLKHPSQSTYRCSLPRAEWLRRTGGDPYEGSLAG